MVFHDMKINSLHLPVLKRCENVWSINRKNGKCNLNYLIILTKKFNTVKVVNTVECRYKAVQSSMILHTSLWQLRQNINQGLIRGWSDTLYLTLSGEQWNFFCEYFWQNWPRYNRTALYLQEPEAMFMQSTVSCLLLSRSSLSALEECCLQKK